MRRLIIALVCVFVSAATAAHAASGKASGTGMTGFQHDLVTVLALRADAEPLLGAALLARTLPDPPAQLSYHALLARAAAAPDAGPAITWAQLVDCDTKSMDCPNAHALATLERQAPHNAAVWLMALGMAERHGDATAAHAALARAAAATTYDDYHGASLKALSEAATALPPPADLYTGPHAAANSAAGVRVLLVFGLGNLQPMPGFHGAAALCAKDTVDTATRATCLRLARTLVWAGAPLARSLGLHLRQTLSPHADQRQAAREAWRDLAWQVHNFGRLTLAARENAQRARSLLHLARRGGTRMSLVLAALRAAHVPVHAPAGWVSRGNAPVPSASTSSH